MKKTDTTEQSGDKLTISQPLTPPSRWIAEQLTVLAEAFSESLTPARLKLYVDNLQDVDRRELANAFRRAVRELTFFPKVAELRALAGSAQQDAAAVEANVAWEIVQKYIRKWGAPPMRVFRGRDEHGNILYETAPELPPAIDYAVRQVGGTVAINRATFESLPFIRKAFTEAFKLAPLAHRLAPQFMATLEPKRLTGEHHEPIR